MAKLGSVATAKTVAVITGTKGMNAGLAALAGADQALAPMLASAQVRPQNAAPDLVDRSRPVRYPDVSVYCEKIANTLTEKFRTFSGTAQMTVEVRHSNEGLAGLQDALELYADSVMHALDEARGDWGSGMYYAGGYDVAFSAVKRGGRNFIQTVKISFEIAVSRS
jgi:hypothetical protein